MGRERERRGRGGREGGEQSMGTTATLGNGKKGSDIGMTGRSRLSQAWPVSLSH